MERPPTTCWRENIRLTVLYASDPYAVLGVNEVFGHRADLASGLATSTQAGISLIDPLSGMRKP